MKPMTIPELCRWLRDHSSGVYRPSADAADVIEQQVAESAKQRERKEWWQKNAEGIARERAELFRAGEALKKIVQEKTYGCTEIAAWDQAAQPLRDMLKHAQTT